MDVNVGIVIGRFQVESLHDGHRFLIGKVSKLHKRMIIFLGCPPIQGTKHDPLDYRTRARMVITACPEAVILPLYDMKDDDKWSEQLDTNIKNIFPNVTHATLYGGRDSFKSHYEGKYSVVEIDDSPHGYHSGTEQRKEIGKSARNSDDFRAGIIYSTQNAFVITRSVVDIGMIKEEEGVAYVLVGKKAAETKWRLPGGHVDKGESLEVAAARELHEETAMFTSGGIADFKYVGSFASSDWRYKKFGEGGLTTALFITKYTSGKPRAGDDLVEVAWINLNDAEKMAVRSHKPLMKALKRRFEDGI